MTPQQQQFLNDFRAIAQGFDANVTVTVLMDLGETAGLDYAELTVRVYEPNYQGQPQKTVCQVNGRTKSEVITKLTQELQKVYVARAGNSERLVLKAETQAEMLQLLTDNGHLLTVFEKSKWMSRISNNPTMLLKVQMQELRELIESKQTGAYVVTGEVIPVKQAS